MYCVKCGNEIKENVKFCAVCGQRVENDKKAEPVSTQATQSFEDEIKEEQAFLDETHRYLRWEKKAWSIFGNVFMILGTVFVALFLFIGLIAAIAESAGMFIIMLVYGGVYGAIFLVPGIIAKKAAARIDFYLESMYTDFETTRARCESVGMIVFCAILNQIALIFYVINFARMKSCKKVISRINERLGNR